MSSTQQLAVGRSYKLRELKARWLKYNHDTGYSVYTSQNVQRPKARYFSVCSAAPTTGWKLATETCRAHLKAIGPNQDEMEVISMETNHTCETAVKRKRNYRTSDVSNMSDLMDIYEPAIGGNAKQFIQMTKSATGITLKTGQATSAVRSKVNDSLEAQIGQYLWVPSLIQAYQETDPGGTYLLENVQCTWNTDIRQFRRCYLCLSVAKQFWHNAGIGLIVCDGTFTRLTGFKQTLLIATTFDANNQLVVLAIAVCDGENGTNWVWFKEQLDKDFPGYTVWMSDADKGITSNAFALSMSQSLDEFVLSRCSRHLSDNCKDACGKRTMNEEAKLLINLLSASRTVYEERLEAIRSINDKWAQWLDDRKQEFVGYCFLERGMQYKRWGKVTSNGVENINGVFVNARSLPIVYMIESMVKYQREKYFDRQQQACKWSQEKQMLSDYAMEELLRLSDMAARRDVQLIEDDRPFYRARVSTSTRNNVTDYIEVSLNVQSKKSKCPCLFREEMGLPCHHIKSLLLHLGINVAGRDSDWCDKRYLVSTYKETYAATIPGMIVKDRLVAEAHYAPSDYKKPPGRPTKKRKSRSRMRKTSVRRQCKACGQPGHFAAACERPSTQFDTQLTMRRHSNGVGSKRRMSWRT